MFTICPIKLASNGFEQNLQRHNESVRCSWIDFISVMELSSQFKLIDRTSLYSGNQKFGRKAFSSNFTFRWSFRQNEALVAMRTLHGGEISSKLCDICASWAPSDQVFEDCNLSVLGSPALEVPLLLNALFPLDQPHHRRHIVDGYLLPLLYSLPRPQHHGEVLRVYWGSAYISSMSLRKYGESFLMCGATDTETFCVNSAHSCRLDLCTNFSISLLTELI